MWCEFTSLVLLPKPKIPGYLWERTHKLKLRDTLQNTSPELLKIVKVMKNKEWLKNGHRSEGLRTWQLNIMLDPRLDPGTEKGKQLVENC